MDNIPAGFRPYEFFSCPSCGEDVTRYEHIDSRERIETECACSQEEADAAGGPDELLAAMSEEESGRDRGFLAKLTEDQFETIHEAIRMLEPELQEKLQQIFHKVAAEFVVHAEEKPFPLTRQDNALLRRIGYKLRENPELSEYPLKMLDVMLILATPSALVEEKRKQFSKRS